MTENEFEMLGVMVPKSDKKAIREMARINRMSISDIARIMINYGLENISKQNILKLV